MFNQSIVVQRIRHDCDVKIYLCQKHVHHNVFKNENLIEFMFNQSIMVQRKFHISKKQ